jgi:hypothetical protein
MTLHEAIEKLILQYNRPMTTTEIADFLNKNHWYTKKDGSKITSFQIHGRTRNYPQIFNRSGSLVSLLNGLEKTVSPDRIVKPKTAKDSDEKYILDLCDKVLGLNSKRQHRFDFLLGDENKLGIAVKLPVDAYYKELNLVIEYREKQHSEEVTFFDKPNKMTVSGVDRGKQRKLYDERRRDILPKQGLLLIEFSYSDFKHDSNKRLIRDTDHDEKIIRLRLNAFKK